MGSDNNWLSFVIMWAYASTRPLILIRFVRSVYSQKAEAQAGRIKHPKRRRPDFVLGKLFLNVTPSLEIIATLPGH